MYRDKFYFWVSNSKHSEYFIRKSLPDIRHFGEIKDDTAESLNALK